MSPACYFSWSKPPGICVANKLRGSCHSVIATDNTPQPPGPPPGCPETFTSAPADRGEPTPGPSYNPTLGYGGTGPPSRMLAPAAGLTAQTSPSTDKWTYSKSLWIKASAKCPECKYERKCTTGSLNIQAFPPLSVSSFVRSFFVRRLVRTVTRL